MVPRFVSRPLALAWALLLAGPLSSFLGLIPGIAGFAMFALGGLLSGIMGVVGAVLVRRAAGPWGRVLAVGIAGFGLVVAPAIPSAGAPPINDISTDLESPPVLESGRALEGVGLPMDYDPSFAAITRQAYPDLGPTVLDADPLEAAQAARRCLTELGALQVLPSAGPGPVQATFSTRVFGFRDDVVVRIQPSDAGSRIDVRSKSRDGKGDMGANAKRIRAIQACLARPAP